MGEANKVSLGEPKNRSDKMFDNMTCFSKYATYDQLQPMNVSQLADRLDDLPRAAAFPVYDDKKREIRNVRRISNQLNDPDITYYVGTEKYEVIQHAEIGAEILRAVRQTGADMRGVFRTREDGSRFYGTMVWEDDRHFELLQKFKEPFKWGVNFSNSYDGGASLRLESFGVRMICCNYNMWGDLLERQKVRHITGQNIGLVADKMAVFMDNLIEKINETFPFVMEVASQGLSSELIEHIPALLVGHGVTGVQEALTIAEPKNFRGLVPEAKGIPTRWDLYNAATSYLTHHAKPTSLEETTYEKFRGAAKLLDETKDQRAIGKGQEKIDSAKRRNTKDLHFVLTTDFQEEFKEEMR